MQSIPTEYEIINIESSDIMLQPGQVLAYLYPTASPDKFHAYVYENIGIRNLSRPKHKAADFNHRKQTIILQSKKRTFSINPLGLIPRMRSILRMRTEDPVTDLPQGLRLIYPPAKAEQETILYPRYL